MRGNLYLDLTRVSSNQVGMHAVAGYSQGGAEILLVLVTQNLVSLITGVHFIANLSSSPANLTGQMCYNFVSRRHHLSPSKNWDTKA